MAQASPHPATADRPTRLPARFLYALAARERATDTYWSRQDPIQALRAWWRAQTVRHMLHLLPGETILELGCGSGTLTRALVRSSRGRNPLTAATFASQDHIPVPTPDAPTRDRWVELVRLVDFPGELAGRTFDHVVGTNLLDMSSAPALLTGIKRLLRPGGRLLLFETNPWNPVFRLRRWLGRWLPFLRRGDERELANQVQLYELLSELGYVRVAATCYDFLYRPIPRWLMLVARNLSLVLENTPGVRKLAGAIVLHAQRPPRHVPRPAVSMAEHDTLGDGVSVVIPCHNEEMNVEPLVSGLLRHYGPYIHEVIPVDDNSTDGTRLVLEALSEAEPRVRPLIRRPPNGVGLALADGLRAAEGRWVLLLDCDFLHILPELCEMFDAAAEGYEVVLGSRFSRESVLINYPLRKIVFNRCFHLLASLLFHRRLRDVSNNLKLLSQSVVAHLELEAAGFAANAETGLKPLLMGYSAHAVPVSWINRTPEMGRSTFSLLRFGSGYARVLASLGWRTRLGFRPLPRVPTKAFVGPAVGPPPGGAGEPPRPQGPG